MTTQRNQVLRRRMNNLKLTPSGLATRLPLASPTPRTTDRHVRMLLNGTIRWPQEHTRQALDRALERALTCPIQDLGFTPRKPPRRRER
jgi:hypothetical protein